MKTPEDLVAEIRRAVEEKKIQLVRNNFGITPVGNKWEYSKWCFDPDKKCCCALSALVVGEQLQSKIIEKVPILSIIPDVEKMTGLDTFQLTDFIKGFDDSWQMVQNSDKPFYLAGWNFGKDIFR